MVLNARGTSAGSAFAGAVIAGEATTGAAVGRAAGAPFVGVPGRARSVCDRAASVSASAAGAVATTGSIPPVVGAGVGEAATGGGADVRACRGSAAGATAGAA